MGGQVKYCPTLCIALPENPMATNVDLEIAFGKDDQERMICRVGSWGLANPRDPQESGLLDSVILQV